MAALFNSKQMQFMATRREKKREEWRQILFFGARTGTMLALLRYSSTPQNPKQKYPAYSLPDSDEFDMQHSLLILNAQLEVFDKKS